MSGVEIRLRHLFDPETGRSLITAYDHGQSMPMPVEPGRRPLELLKKVVDGGPDGVLVNPGILRNGGELFAPRNAPVAVLRADWTYLDARWKAELGEHYRVLTTPAEALALGAGAICMYLIGRPMDGGIMADNVAAVAKAAHEAHRVGIPLIVEGTLWGLRNTDQKDPEYLQMVCRLAVECGADAIKTEYLGSEEAMTGLIAACGEVPVLTLGGAKGDAHAVKSAADGAIKAGAKGLIFGRNIWNTDDPVATTKSLRGIVHGKAA